MTLVSGRILRVSARSDFFSSNHQDFFIRCFFHAGGRQAEVDITDCILAYRAPVSGANCTLQIASIFTLYHFARIIFH